ncbi:MAG: DUF177 domain-containing protein [Clostridiales bacterium]|nr:DUF177 domain-containing protein [Clostridiales bacterium]
MLINLTDVLTSEGKVVKKQVDIDMAEFNCRLGDFPVVDKTPLTLTFANLGINKASIEGKMELTFAMNCDRCLKPVNQKIILDFIRTVTGPDEYKEDAQDDDQNFMEGYQLNVDDLIKNECFINLPAKVLCKTDCKGICMQCGKDLNMGKCGCDTFVPDPRMARIKDIFDANKEV